MLKAIPNTVTPEQIKFWRVIVRSLTVLGVLGLAPVTLIYVDVLMPPVGEITGCISDDGLLPKIEYGELVSTASMYVTILVSAILGQLAINLSDKNSQASVIIKKRHVIYATIIGLVVGLPVTGLAVAGLYNYVLVLCMLVSGSIAIFHYLPIIIGIGFCVDVVIAVFAFRQRT